MLRARVRVVAGMLLAIACGSKFASAAPPEGPGWVGTPCAILNGMLVCNEPEPGPAAGAPKETDRPAVCQPAPENFFTERTAFIDAEHRQFDVGGVLVRVGTKERLQQRIATERNPVNAAILQVDLLRLNNSEGFATDNQKVGIHKTLQTFLIGANTPPAAEALAAFAAHLSGDEEQRNRKKLISSALDYHRRIFGDTPRQYTLWKALFNLAEHDDEKRTVARAFLHAAERMGSVSILLEARLALFHLLPNGDGQKKLLAKEIADSGLEAFGVARNLECNIIDRYTSNFVSAFGLAGRDTDRRAFIKFVVQRVGFGFGTHAGFVLADMRKLLAARAIDFDSYLEAMARPDPIEDICKDPNENRLVCNMVTISLFLLETNNPSLAVTVLRDAEQLIKRLNVSEKLSWRVRVVLADVEWRHGARSAAAAQVARMSYVDLKRSGTPLTLVSFHKLRAEMADAVLDPQQATESLSAAIEIAVTFIQSRSQNDVYQDDYRHAYLTIDRLIQRHLAGRFCGGCGSPLAGPAVRWINVSSQLGMFADEAGSRGVLSATVYGRSVPELRETSRHIKALREALGDDWQPMLEATKRSLKAGSSEAEGIRFVALARALAPAAYVRGGNMEVFIRFLHERDREEQRRLWAKELIYSEDQDTDWFHDAVERGADLLFRLGYKNAAEIMVLHLSESEARETENDTINFGKRRAAFWGSVYARLAEHAVERKDWVEAARYLGQSQRIISARLDEDWALSADQIGPLIRELHAAATRLAEARVRIAVSVKGEGQYPAEAFEALQLAMLGETAAGMQASIRRRLTAEPQLAAAIQIRDQLRARIDLNRAFDEVVGVIDETERSREMAELRRRLAEAEQRVATLLPASETIGSLRPLQSKETQELLEGDEALLMLHVGDTGVSGSMLIAQGEPLYWFTRISRADLEQWITELHTALDGEHGVRDFPLEKAHNLFGKLLGTVRPKLERLKRVLVLVDGPLVSLPLAVLPLELPQTLPKAPADYRGARVKWLGLSHAIAYLPALRGLQARKAPRLASQAKMPFVGIANPVIGTSPALTRRVDYAAVFKRRALADGDLLRRLVPLPETEDEVRAVGKLLGAREEDIFAKTRASEGLVRRNGLGSYRVIMFATHGAMGGEVTGMSEPGLVLTPPKSASVDDDGFLTASEVATMKLDADLVILSACNTAASDGRPRAEGYSGLTRAFLSAGARSVIATHWAIPSRPAVAVTTTMMTEHRRNPRLAWSEALRRSFAQLVEREGPPEYAHPTNWAAFAVVGPEVSSLFADSAAGATSPKKASAKAPRSQPQQKTFKLFQGVDFMGGDIGTPPSWQSVSLDECRAACVKDLACLYYSYSHWKRVCYLKKHEPLQRVDAEYVSGAANGLNPPPRSEASIYMRTLGKKTFDPEGDDFTKVSNLNECADLCLKDSSCQAAEFLARRNACYLFEDGTELVSGNGSVAIKYQDQ